MKKLIPWILTTLLLFSVLAFSSSAADLALGADILNGAPGDVVRFTVSAAGLPASESVSVSFTYSGDFFEYVPGGGWSVDGSNALSVSFSGTGGQISVSSEHPLEGNLTLCSFSLKIKAYGEAQVSASFSATGESTVSSSASVTVSAPCPGHQFSDWAETKEPTCTEDAVESHVCSVCGLTETRAGRAALGHDWGLWSVVTHASCEEEGLQECHCSRCEAVDTRKTPATGHTVPEFTVTKEPTCTEAGEKSGVCTREGCGKTVTEPVAAIGHNWGNWTTTKEPTCTEPGEQTRTCTRCPEHTTRPAAALGHDFEDPQVEREATLSQTGLMRGKCRRCQETTDQILPCHAEDASGISVTAGEGAFAEGSVFSVSALTKGAASYDFVKTALAELSSSFTAYDLAAIAGGAAVQPSSPVTLVFPVPEGYDAAKTRLYEIAEDGTAKPVEAELSDDAKTLTAEVSALARFALADLSAGTETPPEPTEPAPSSSETPTVSRRIPTSAAAEEGVDSDSLAAILVVVGVAVIAVVAAVLVYPKGKRRG